MKVFALIASLASLTLLNACAPTPSLPEPITPAEQPAIVAPPPSITATPTLIEQRQQALSSQNWLVYLDTTETLLFIATPEQQSQLLFETYIQLERIPSAFWQQPQTLRHQAWSTLAHTHRVAKSWQAAWLEDTQALYYDHLPTQQLTQRLLEQIRSPQSQRIAVLLPYDDRTRVLSNQIRAGILAAYWQTTQQDQILFFNLEDFNNPIEAYEATQQAGADWVIGPYDRNTIEKLSPVANDRLIFLNSSPNSPETWQLQFPTPQAMEQLIEQVMQQNYRNLAILYANQPTTQNQLAQIRQLWLQVPDNRLIPLVFEQNQRNLREELGRALQSDQSQVRANFLQRTLGTNLTFFPRHRADLDSILLLGEREYLANIQPQLDFFQTNLPLYATDNLMPNRFSIDLTEPDLKNIRFLSYPAALAPELLTTPLEALGWDAFLITQYAQALEDGLALNAATGQLRRHRNGPLDRQLAQLQFNQRGQLQAVNNHQRAPFANFTGQIAPLHPRERQQRQRELLELITQPSF